MLLLLLFTGCAGDIHALYQAERDAALAPAGAVGDDWQPDLRLRLSEGALQDFATAAVDGGLLDFDRRIRLEGPLGIEVVVRPRARVRSLQVGPSDRCEACLKVTGALRGSAAWRAGPLEGSLPFSADLGGLLAFSADEAGGGWDLSGRLRSVTALSVSAGAIKDVAVGPELRGWLQEALDEAPAIPLGRIGGGKLPLRKLRLNTRGGQVEVQALTEVSGGQPVQPGRGRVRDGWELRMSEATVGALLRRQAFQQGLLERDVALDPRAIDFEGDRFTLDLRLWRLAGAGWWRDYTVTGGATVVDGRIVLRSEEAAEGDKSKGAGLADPLALLAEGRILQGVADGVRQAVPASRTAKVATARLHATTTGLHGDGDALVLTGEAVLQ